MACFFLLTCPEESLIQIGTIEQFAPPNVLAQIAAEFFAEFKQRFGEHVRILDWLCTSMKERHTFMSAITGIHGNFYSNPFYYNIGDTPEQEVKIKAGLGQAIRLVPGKSEQGTVFKICLLNRSELVFMAKFREL